MHSIILMTKEEGKLCCYPGAENLSETRCTHGSEVSGGGSFVIKREQRRRNIGHWSP